MSTSANLSEYLQVPAKPRGPLLPRTTFISRPWQLVDATSPSLRVLTPRPDSPLDYRSHIVNARDVKGIDQALDLGTDGNVYFFYSPKKQLKSTVVGAIKVRLRELQGTVTLTVIKTRHTTPRKSIKTTKPFYLNSRIQLDAYRKRLRPPPRVFRISSRHGLRFPLTGSSFLRSVSILEESWSSASIKSLSELDLPLFSFFSRY